MNRRYKVASTVVTSNKGLEGGEIFGHDVMAGALIDRPLHHSHIVNIRGNSYRLRVHSEFWQTLHPTSESTDSPPKEAPTP